MRPVPTSTLPVRPAVALVLATVAIGEAASAAVVETTYVGPTNGNWSTALNWNPAIVPNNGGGSTYDVAIDGAVTVLMGLSPTIDALAIGPNSTLNVGAGFDPRLMVGPLHNDGVLQLNGSGSILRLGGDIALTGAGVIKMSNSAGNSINADGGVRRLTNHVDHTIRGSGSIGAGEVFLLTNHGLIEATASVPLTLTLAGNLGDNVNTGTLRANGGTLVIFDTDLVNSGGSVVATTGSIVRFSYGMFEGGDLVAENGGQFQVVESSLHLFRDISLVGTFRMIDAIWVEMQGTIENNGTIVIDGGGFLCTLHPSMGMSFLGTGVIQGNGTNARVFGSPVAFTNGPEHTIRGGMRLGQGSNPIALINLGMIEATSSVDLQVFATGEPGLFQNTGVMRANGGELIFQSGRVENAGGEILATDGDVVTLRGATILDGVLRAEGSGEVQCNKDFVSGIDGAALDGTVRVLNGATLEVAGLVTNGGTMIVHATSTITDLSLVDNASLLGRGTLLLASDNARVRAPDGPATLVNGAGHTIRGAGRLGDNLGLSVINEGLILADGSTPMIVDVAGFFANAGDVRVANGATLLAAPGVWTSGGTLSIESGATLSRTGALTQTGGEAEVDGSLDIQGGAYELQAGFLRGDGVVMGDVMSAAGSVLGDGLTVTGSYTQQSMAALAVTYAIPGAPAPFQVGGVATLDGTLEISLASGDSPVPGDSFTVLEAGSVVGEFARVQSCEPVQLVHGQNAVVAVFTGRGALGDLDADGDVGRADLSLLLEQWGPCGDDCCLTDINGDGVVDGRDLGLLLAEWRRGRRDR